MIVVDISEINKLNKNAHPTEIKIEFCIIIKSIRLLFVFL